MNKTNCSSQVLKPTIKSDPHPVMYENIKREAETWPGWKKDAYNSLAMSAHAIKIK
jgi:hypothetical protein